MLGCKFLRNFISDNTTEQFEEFDVLFRSSALVGGRFRRYAAVFHRFCPERVGYIGLSKHGANLGVEGTVHPFRFAVVYRVNAATAAVEIRISIEVI
jgi:hypothetical protein